MTYSIGFMLSILAATLSAVLVHQCAHAAVCKNPSAYAGQLLCYPTGVDCGKPHSFVKVCTGDTRPTTSWKKGIRVQGANITVGTAIANFNLNNNENYDGESGMWLDENFVSSAAIYVGQDKYGIQVWDQWGEGFPVAKRTIRLISTGGPPPPPGDRYNADIGELYHVII